MRMNCARAVPSKFRATLDYIVSGQHEQHVCLLCAGYNNGQNKPSVSAECRLG